MGESYYRGAVGIILVYDVTDETSYKSVEYWLNKIDQIATPESQLILLGNKIDLINQINVD